MSKSKSERAVRRLIPLLLSLAFAAPAEAETPAKAPAARPSSAAPAKPPASPAAPPAAAAPAPAAPGAEPTVTTSVFGDWTLRCAPAAAPAARTCEVIQSIVLEGRTAPTAQLVVGRLTPKDPLRVAVVLPNNVALAAPPRVSTGEADPRPLDLAWRRSLPAGCFADAIGPDQTLAAWRTATEPGRILFADGAGRPITLPVSFRGLAQALDALAKT